jgi:hypothetical protein
MQVAVLDISSSDDEREVVRSSSFKRSLAPVANDDDDEVIVIDKPYWFEKPNWHSKRPKNRRQIEESEQNDCWVLDGDPDKVDPDPGSCTDEKEDLVVTAEKGPVACRDFPHPRHFCVIFPFNSTPHEKHCILCHCYVCDKLAPCLHWGKGNAINDHCHSSDKEEKWTKLRNFHKMRKTPSMAIPNSFNAIFSLATRGSSVPGSRSNQGGTGALLPVHSNLNIYARQSSLSARPDQGRSLSSRNTGNRNASIEIPSSGYTNYVSSQNRRFGPTGSRFGSSVPRNASNLGVHRQGDSIQRSSRSRLTSVDSLQHRRDSRNLLLSSNTRENTTDTFATSQIHAMNANDMLPRDFSCAHSYLVDEHLTKLCDFLLGSDSDESNRAQNDSSRDPSINHSIEPSSIPELTNMITTQPNASGQLSSSCVAPNQELQLFPQLSISAGVSNAVDNLVPWPVVQPTSDLITSMPIEQCSYSLDFQSFNCDWLNDTEYPPLHPGADSWVQTGSEVTVALQDWNYVTAQPVIQNNESICSDNIPAQSPGSHDTETVVLISHGQRPEWTVPMVPQPDVSDTKGQFCSEQGFSTSPTLVDPLCIELNRSCETVTTGKDWLY